MIKKLILLFLFLAFGLWFWSRKSDDISPPPENLPIENDAESTLSEDSGTSSSPEKSTETPEEKSSSVGDPVLEIEKKSPLDAALEVSESFSPPPKLSFLLFSDISIFADFFFQLIPEPKNAPKSEETTKIISKKYSPRSLKISSVTPSPPARPSPAKIKSDAEKIINTTIRVYLYEWAINSNLKVAKSGTILFRVQNSGKLLHNFSITSEYFTKNLGDIPAGKSAEFSLFLPKGSYTIYSDKKRDTDRGMAKIITVE